jgi:hypothetical protein
MKKIFLSYAHKDGEELAEYFHERLSACDWDVWKDSHDLSAGRNFPGAISNALEQTEVFIIIVSPQALTSEWVADEVNMAAAARCTILPVVLQGITNDEIPLLLRTKNYIVSSGVKDWEALHRLVNELDPEKKIPRVYSYSGQTATTYQGVLLVGRSQWADANPKNPEELSKVAKNMWREYLEVSKKVSHLAIVPPGYAPLALAFLAHLVKVPNLLPRMYYPERGADGTFQVRAGTCVDLQQLRDMARFEVE